MIVGLGAALPHISWSLIDYNELERLIDLVMTAADIMPLCNEDKLNASIDLR